MSHNSQSQHIQQIEHLMTTVVTCRSLLKYNLPLSDEQKKDLLGDLDTALEVLRSYLVPPPPAAPAPVAGTVAVPTWSSSHSADYLPVSSMENSTSATCAHTGIVPSQNHEQTLNALYRMYHTFLNVKQPVNLNSFVSRFNEIMTTLNELQQLIEGEHDQYQSYTSESKGEDALQRVRVFIADLYYIFMEFMRSLSDTLQKNNVQLDTEKVSSLSREAISTLSPSSTPARDLAPLFGVYEAHQRLNEKRGMMNERISDVTAFLEFLKEGLATDIHMSKRAEIQSQIGNVNRLLHELSRLLVEYEKATAALFLR